MASHVPFYCYDYIYCNHKYYFKEISGSAAYTELPGLYTSCPNLRHASHCLEPPAEMLWGGQRMGWRRDLLGLQIVLGRLIKLIGLMLPCAYQFLQKPYLETKVNLLNFYRLNLRLKSSCPILWRVPEKLSCQLYICVWVCIYLYTYTHTSGRASC